MKESENKEDSANKDDDSSDSVESGSIDLLNIALDQLALAVDTYDNSLLYIFTKDVAKEQKSEAIKFFDPDLLEKKINESGYDETIQSAFILTHLTYTEAINNYSHRIDQILKYYADDYDKMCHALPNAKNFVRDPAVTAASLKLLLNRFFNLRKKVYLFIEAGLFDSNKRRLTNAFKVQRDRCRIISEEIDFLREVTLETSRAMKVNHQIGVALDGNKKNFWIAVGTVVLTSLVTLWATLREADYSQNEIDKAEEVSHRTIAVKTESQPLTVALDDRQINEFKIFYYEQILKNLNVIDDIKAAVADSSRDLREAISKMAQTQTDISQRNQSLENSLKSIVQKISDDQISKDDLRDLISNFQSSYAGDIEKIQELLSEIKLYNQLLSEKEIPQAISDQQLERIIDELKLLQKKGRDISFLMFK